MINETHVGRLVRVARGPEHLRGFHGVLRLVGQSRVCQIENEGQLCTTSAADVDLVDECKRCQKRIEPIQAVRSAEDAGPFCSSACAGPGFYVVPDGTVLAAGTEFVCERGHTWELRSGAEIHRSRLGRARLLRLGSSIEEECSGMLAYITKLVLPPAGQPVGEPSLSSAEAHTAAPTKAAEPKWHTPRVGMVLPPGTVVHSGKHDYTAELLTAVRVNCRASGREFTLVPHQGQVLRYRSKGGEFEAASIQIVSFVASPRAWEDAVKATFELLVTAGIVKPYTDQSIPRADAFKPGSCQTCGAEGGEMFGVVCAGCFHGARQTQRDRLLPAPAACFTKQEREPGELSERAIERVQRSYDEERADRKRVILRLDLNRKVGPRYPNEARSDRVLEQPKGGRRP